jgi:uncharacterized protein YkwD
VTRRGACGRGARAVGVMLAAATLSSCLPGTESRVGPTVVRPHASHPVAVDPAKAAQLISAFRAQHGLPPVVVSSRLVAVAAAQARTMAAQDTMSHTVAGQFETRMEAAGYDAEVAAENIGEGYQSLAEALEGWTQSPEHRANLLRDVTEIGIATGYTPQGRSNVFWSLELAKPHMPRPGGPVAVPALQVELR